MVLDALRGYVQLASGLTDVTRQRAVQAARQLVDSSSGFLDAAVNSAGSVDFSRQVQGLAEDILATSRTNRDLMVGLVRTEVERTVHRLGLVGADELSAMARVVERLQAQLDAAVTFGGRGFGSAEAPQASAPRPRTVRRDPVTFRTTPAAADARTPRKGPAASASGSEHTSGATKKATLKKTTVKKAPVKKAPVKKAPVKKAPLKTTAKKTTAKKTTAKKAPAVKAAATQTPAKAPAKKAPASKAPAKKAAVKKAAVKKAAARKATANTTTSATQPPATQPPATTALATQPPATTALATQPPATTALATTAATGPGDEA